MNLFQALFVLVSTAICCSPISEAVKVILARVVALLGNLQH